MRPLPRSWRSCKIRCIVPNASAHRGPAMKCTRWSAMSARGIALLLAQRQVVAGHNVLGALEDLVEGEDLRLVQVRTVQLERAQALFADAVFVAEFTETAYDHERSRREIEHFLAGGKAVL